MRQGSTPLSHGLLSVDAKARQTVWQRQNFYSVSTLLLLAGTFAGCSTEPVRAAAKKSGKSGGLQNRIKKAAGFVARTHRFLAVRFRYGLSSGSWNLQ